MRLFEILFVKVDENNCGYAWGSYECHGYDVFEALDNGYRELESRGVVFDKRQILSISEKAQAI
jgi:hypothetical protein